jgi:hypothetical protein
MPGFAPASFGGLMASVFLGVDVGANKPSDVTKGSSTGSKAVELQIDLSKVTDRLQVYQCLEAIEYYIEAVLNNPVS